MRTEVIAIVCLVGSLSPIHASVREGSVSGTVLSALDSRPLRRVVVTVRGEAIATNLSTISDEQGHFRIDHVPPGRYRLDGNREGYLPSSYGAKGPGRIGTQIVLGVDGDLKGLTVTLWKACAISGTIRDVVGQPVSNTAVTVTRINSFLSGSGALTTSQVMTDDEGSYRAWGLWPGEYVVAAVPQASDATIANQARTADVDAWLRWLQQRSGATTLGPPPQPTPTSVTQSRRSYAPVFYPGTAFASRAERLALDAGDDRQGVDIVLGTVPMSRLAGRIVAGDGTQLTSIRLSLSPLDSPLAPSSALRVSPDTRHDGSFEYAGLPPGRYVLIAQSTPTPAKSVQGTTVASGFPGEILASDALVGTMEVEVDGHDAEGIDLVLTAGSSVRGRVIFESDKLQSVSPERMKIGLVRPSFDLLNKHIRIGFDPTVAAPSPAAPDLSGQFQLKSVLAGEYLVSVSGLPSGWRVKAALLGDQDLLDTGLELTSGATLPELRIVLSDKETGLTGVLRLEDGSAATDYFIVLFPAAKNLWLPGGRRIAVVRPGQDGRYRISGVPAGEYLLAALTDVLPGEWNDTSFLDQLVSHAVQVKLGEGQESSQDLRIGR